MQRLIPENPFIDYHFAHLKYENYQTLIKEANCHKNTPEESVSVYHPDLCTRYGGPSGQQA